MVSWLVLYVIVMVISILNFKYANVQLKSISGNWFCYLPTTLFELPWLNLATGDCQALPPLLLISLPFSTCKSPLSNLKYVV